MKVLALLLLVATATAVDFKDCGGFSAKLISFEVSNCSTNATACSFKSGQTVRDRKSVV